MNEEERYDFYAGCALIAHHPDALRNDPDLRRDTAAEAKAIMDKMSVFMGA